MPQLMKIVDEQEWLEKRKNYVTSTEAASLFGLQMPSLPTAFELWHIKRGLIDHAVDVNARMIWGRRLEAVIASGIAQDYEFAISSLDDFAYDDADKIGSSFDYEIVCPERGPALMEIKTVSYRDYKEKFIEDDERGPDGLPVFIEAPPYYEVQVQHEMEVIDKYGWCCLAVFVMDTRDVKLLWRQRDREMGAAIRQRVREFWAMKEPPPPDLVKDSDLLARMHRANNSDKTYNGTESPEFVMAAQAYLDETAREKQADEAKKKARSQMILAMGDCNTAWCDVARISNKAQFRVTGTKEKK
jgi:predicted phage-related endonuclease